MRARRPPKKQTPHEEPPKEETAGKERPLKKKPKTYKGRLRRASLLFLGVAATVVFYIWTKPPHRFVRLSNLRPMLSSPEFDMHHKHNTLWGTYRPGAYFGLKTREKSPMIAGLAWIRHLARESDGLGSYGWLRHDGKSFGVQQIIDDPYNITTSWVKDFDMDNDLGGDWSTRISVQPSHGHQRQNISLFFYFADETGPGHPEQFPLDWEIPNDANLGETGKKLLKGSHGKSDWSLYVQSQSLDKMRIRSAARPEESFHNITEQLQVYLYESLAVQWTRVQPNQHLLKLHLPEPDIWWESPTMTPNFVIFEIEFPVPFDIEFVFLSGPKTKATRITSSEQKRFRLLTGESLTLKIQKKIAEFDKKFRRVFGGSSAGDSVRETAKRALSNLLGGIGYFYGSSIVGLGSESTEGKEKLLEYGPAGLLTAVPSRSFFPRGFLWDEGFHQLLVHRWDSSLSRDIISHWLDRMNIDGWIPREQILGEEAQSRVPREFVVQRPNVLNPPTFFMPLMVITQELLDGHLQKEEAGRALQFLETAWPRLQKWLSYLTTSQQGSLKTSFRWHGRDQTTDRELNPRTMDSGLDDYPRSSHPSNIERHLDLRCWIAYAVKAMASIGEAIHADKEVIDMYNNYSAELRDIDLLNILHLDKVSGHYADYGHHTEHVRLKKVQSDLPQQDEVLKRVGSQPTPGYVPHFGYVSLFPFLLCIFEPDHPAVGELITDMKDPELLWTDYGLRSLSKTSSLYNTSNTQHDPPYWRGAIWININFMALQALKHYSRVDGPFMKKAGATFAALKRNVVNNVVAEYERTGYIWEQYDDITGLGKRSHPFTGWTALFVLMIED